MAVRLHFIVEGQTEETFVNRVLGPHLANQSIWAKARCVLTSRKRGIKHRGGNRNVFESKKRHLRLDGGRPELRRTLYHHV